MKRIDLNCDLGEAFGAWQMGLDTELMDYVSSVNIACGFHAGDSTVICRTVEAAIAKEVAIGAHPGYPDLQGFGRRNMSLAPREVFEIVLYQVSALKGICEALGGRLHHVKPHGALYNQAAKDKDLAKAISEAVIAIDENLVLYGLSNSRLISEASKIGLKTASEVFADRTYRPDGSLTPRSESRALITKAQQAAAQVMQMVKEQSVTATGGEKVPIKAETVCIHGDGKHALAFARTVNKELTAAGIAIERP